MIDTLERMWRRIQFIVGRGRLTFVDDAGAVQTVQVKLSAREFSDGTPRLGEYGFQSVPPLNSDAVVLFFGGERAKGVVIATGHQTYRMRGLASGEVAISDDKGQSVYLSAAGIRIDGGGLPIEISNTPHITADATQFTMTGSLEVTGSITAGADIADQGGATTMAGMRGTYNGHHHGTSPTPDASM